MAQLEFHGAAQTVTGSMHLLHLSEGTFTLDCGLFQGKRSRSRELNSTFPVDPKQLKGVVLSHAHLDHSGNIPRLVRTGFTGTVFATSPTCDLCEVMLADSAYLQEEDARYWNEKRAKGPQDFIEPLYTVQDAQNSERFFLGLAYGEPFSVASDCKATFFEAGHVLGSAVVLLELDGNRPVRLLYTGDLGRFHQPILRDPKCPLPQADYLITECTYADRRHDDPRDMKESLVRIIDETRSRGGKCIIPAFSLGRTQTVVYFLEQAVAEKLLEPLPIYVDSPLSSAATQVFRNHPECFDPDALALLRRRGEVFGDNGLVTYVTDVSDSKRLHELHDPCVIISASGMCEGGRILHHLKNNVEDPRNTIIVVGYMAADTLGRRIVEKRDEIKVFGRMYKLRARVEILNGFSAHADADDFAHCFASIAPNLKAAFVVHGEASQPEAMRDILRRAGCSNVSIPAPGDRFDLT